MTLPLHWQHLVAVHVQECSGVNDGFLLQLLSHARALCSLSVVACEGVTAGGFASIVCTRLCQLEIVQCANVEPDDVMDASARVIGGSLAAFNLSRGCLGVLQLNHLHFITVLVIDFCYGVTQAAAEAVVDECCSIRLLSAAGVAAFGCCDVLLRLHELPLVRARLTCNSDLNTWVCVASFALCARGLQSLVMFVSGDDDDDDDERLLHQPKAVDGAGAEECARAAASCLRMRGGSLETIVWSDARDSWRL